MFKNIFAAIGVVTVAIHAVRGYNRYLARPIENIVTDAIQAESNRQAEQAYEKAGA